MDLLCRFCGIKCGEWKDGNPNDVVDVRCDTHEAEHGNYKRMEEKFRSEISTDYTKWQEFIEKSEYKETVFLEELEKEKQKILEEKQKVDVKENI